jgi:hypothetical protein
MTRDDEEADAWARSIIANHCPDCGNYGFIPGPSGGLAQNLFCANPACRSGFNVTLTGGRCVLCRRIHKGGEKREHLLTRRQWFSLPFPLRQRWWRETEFDRKQPPPELWAEVLQELNSASAAQESST